MTEEFKPCPRCGMSSYALMDNTDWLGAQRFARPPSFVLRHYCGPIPDAEFCDGYHEVHGRTRAEVFAAWNRRALSPEVSALVDAARDAEGALLAAFAELSDLANTLSREPATSARCYRAANALRAALTPFTKRSMKA